MGEGESVATERPFHNMKAVESTRAKLRIWVRNCRGWREESAENMVALRRENRWGGKRTRSPKALLSEMLASLSPGHCYAGRFLF